MNNNHIKNNTVVSNNFADTPASVMPFSRNYRMFKMRQTPLVNSQSPPSPVQRNNDIIVQEKPPTMKWGKAIWTMFHTLAEKISDESFAIIGNELILTITKICGNLPCPTCSEHATSYISKNRFNSNYIQTKEQLRTELFKFHNFVNSTKGYPQFQFEKLTETYLNLDTIVVIRDFLLVFKDKHFSIRMIANDFHRNRMSTQLTTWFNANVKYFV
jgi:hypothetical protein